MNFSTDITTDVPLLVDEGKTPKKKSSGFKAVVITVAIIAVLLLAGVAVFVVLVVLDEEPESDYGIIIDAGSSGSRIYVYKWPHRRDNTTIPKVNPVVPKGADADIHSLLPGIVQLRLNAGSNTKKPGIAKIKPADIDEYLKPLLEYATALIPEKDRKRTPIFLFATAGMRVLDEKEQDAIIDAVRKTLKKSPFDFSYQTEWARVISGREEGVFGWVTTNYLKGYIMDEDAKNKVVGALDLGGASLQITFEPHLHPANDSFILTLPKHNFDLYTHSFLRFGQDLITKNLMNLSAHNAMVGGKVPDEVPFPCYLNGYSEVVQLDIDGKNHTMKGTGNYSLCSEYEIQLMDLDAKCTIPPCSIDGIYQPNVTGDFYAMSGFYYTAQFFGINSETNKTSAKKFLEHGQEYCSLKWEDVVKKYHIDADLLKVYCLTSSYIYNLLTAGFHFDAEKTNIYFTSEIQGTTLNWALGGLIAEASLLPK